MSGFDRHYLTHHAVRAQYFDVELDNYYLFALNNTSSSYMLISSALAQELGLRIKKCKKTFKVVDSEL